MDQVIVEDRGSVRWITINREGRRNALNEQVVTAIGNAIETAEVAGARAIILTGVGERAFCAGADLVKNTEGFAFAVDHAKPTHYLVGLFRKMELCRVPIVARVNGAVMAGGFGVLCACNLAVAVDDAIFGTPEVKIGLAPMMILPAMMRVVPERKLMEMTLTGEPWDAREALELGLVNYVVPRGELDSKLDWLLSRIVDKSPAGQRIGMQGVTAMRSMSFSDALEYAQVMVASMASTADAAEGMDAFSAKRAPVWHG
jgi:enoyl-CoA hydratase/carnithine racemase